MSAIYKYYSPSKNSLDAIEKRIFWFSKRRFLNDPFDMNVQIIELFPQLQKYLKEIDYDLEKYYSEIESYGICCFSEDDRNKHLWALYADSYKGFCLEFESEKLVSPSIGVPNKLIHVCYQSSWPNLDLLETEIIVKQYGDGAYMTTPLRELFREGERGMEKLFTYIVSAKEYSIWKEEKELRLVLGNTYLKAHPNISKATTGYEIPWGENCLKKIIVGHNADSGLLNKLADYARKYNVGLFQTMPILEDLNYRIDLKEISPVCDVEKK